MNLKPALLLLLAATAPACGVEVFPSAGSSCAAGSAPALTPDGAVATLDLCIRNNSSAATAAGTVCVDGDGAEICGWSLTLQAVEGAEFAAFTPGDGVLAQTTGKMLRVNAIRPVEPGLTPQFIGTVRIRSIGRGQLVSSGSYVTAAAKLAEIPRQTLVQSR
jgi:hypothetical protein